MRKDIIIWFQNDAWNLRTTGSSWYQRINKEQVHMNLLYQLFPKSNNRCVIHMQLSLLYHILIICTVGMILWKVYTPLTYLYILFFLRQYDDANYHNNWNQKIYHCQHILLLNLQYQYYPNLSCGADDSLFIYNRPPCSPSILIIGRWNSVPRA